MEQRSDEWFEARKGVITGSRVGSILGVNPYATRDDVMREMVREYFDLEKEFKGNIATDHGEKMEPIALAFYEKLTGNKVDSTGIVKHEKFDWLGASPDGLIGIDGGLEIKCPYWAKAPYSVKDKPSYMAQCQLIMEVCDLEWMDFFCFIGEDETKHKLERIERDRSWFKKNFDALFDFISDYRSTIADPDARIRFTQSNETLVLDSRADRLAEIAIELKRIEASVESLRSEYDELKALLGNEFGSFRSGRLKLSRIVKKGAVDNKKLYADLSVEALLAKAGKSIDDYRKGEVVSYSVTIVDE